jgi:predicted choloylglycine hydrolase|tara:strand:+ start:1313 stop:1612 length:300 start_codon:yes stop_codon:yes gene_type:complete
MKKILLLLFPLFSFAQMDYTGISELGPSSQDLNVQINNICNNCFIYQVNRLPLYNSIERQEQKIDAFESKSMLLWKTKYLNNNYNFTDNSLPLNQQNGN